MNQLKMKKMYNKHCIKNGVKKALKWILKKFYNDNYERMSKIIRNLLKNISTRRAPNVVYVDEQKCVELIFFNKYYGTAYKTHGPDNDALVIETDMSLLNKFFYEKDPWNACRGDHIQVIKDKKLLFSPKDVNHDFISKIISNNFVRNSILFYLDNYFLEAHITKIPISVNKIIERIKATLFQEDENNIKQVWKLQGVSEWGPDYEAGPDFEVGAHKKSDFDHKKSDFDHKKSDFDHKKSDFDHKKSDFDHKKSDFDHKKSDFDHKNPILTQNEEIMGKEGAKVDFEGFDRNESEMDVEGEYMEI
jgi:hypothetical protein